MKRNIISLTFMLCSALASAQVNTQNYIRIRKMLDDTGTSYVDDIRYHDGLGRPFQTVQKSVQGSTVKKRTGTLQEYDNAGRGSSQWLPTPLTEDYLAPATFKTTAQSSTGYGDTYPYIQPLYEASPLDRPLQQYGAGAAWRSASRVIRTEYLLNTASGVQACKLYNTSGTSVGNHVAGTLHVVKTTDEDNHVVYAFTDKQGRVVLERYVNGTEYLDTYSVYDDFGNLVLVLQPEYQTTASLSLYAFQYEYNARNLCSKKTLPGAGYISYEYDNADRLVFSQDGNQRIGSKYTYYLYDDFGRVTAKGECTDKATSSGTVHIRNYYDSYSFVGSGSFASGYTAGNATNSKGFLTGTEVTVLGSSNKICTVYHYDGKGRVIKSVSNNLLGGTETTTTTYSFTGNPLTVNHVHTASGKTSRTEVYTYTYDYSDRLSSVKHKLGSGTEVTLASYTYDSLGRQSTKKLHGNSTNQLTYTYNIRNWLTGISSSKFTQDLDYDNHYNGNISSMDWTANDTSHSYTFTYDGVNRMLDATHGTGAYTEKVTEYDKNGNIVKLLRYGNGLIDNLTYTYSGNQLTRVDDATGNAAGFSNGASTVNEYTYDNNGNLTKDSNKGISNIAYNCLNLPSKVTFSDGSTITYSYAADGTKLRTVHVISGTTTQKDYCANVVYEDSIQKLLLTEEGYVDLSASTPTYYYYLKDHQGNNRVVVNSSGTVQETNHYYPFGGVFASTGNVQPYKYNGKELDTKKGLNWYDYGARHYDAMLGRWFVADPLAEKYYAWSPYAYCFNNPIKFIDVDGKYGESIWDVSSFLIGVKSLTDNIKYRNIGSAIVDGVGIVLDAVAIALPGVPGGVSSGIKTVRNADNLVDAISASTKSDNVASGLKNADAIREGKAFEKSELGKAISDGVDVKGQVRLVPENGVGNVKGNRSTVDQLIRNEDGTYSVVETKLRSTTPMSKGQNVIQQHVGNNGGWFEIRTDIPDWSLYKGRKIEVKEYIRRNKYE